MSVTVMFTGKHKIDVPTLPQFEKLFPDVVELSEGSDYDREAARGSEGPTFQTGIDDAQTKYRLDALLDTALEASKRWPLAEVTVSQYGGENGHWEERTDMRNGKIVSRYNLYEGEPNLVAEFDPNDGVADFYQMQWQRIKDNPDTGGWFKLQLTGDSTQHATRNVNVTIEQAERILKMLSAENRAS